VFRRGGIGIEGAQQIEVYVVGLQPGQAVFYAADQVESGKTTLIGGGMARAEDLGAQEDLLAFVLDRLADDGFRATLAVEGTVEKVAAQIDRTVDDTDANLLVVLGAEGRAQTQLGDFDAGVAK
jgi:alkanesulfonate monooxygenase SsuD/methylene tetrahydromethanopterin reductase-like flavin-dependent oxidoreductase (luciferase family)